MRVFKQAILMILIVTATLGLSPPARAQEPFLGEIRWVAFNFAPRGWAFCDGQLLSIAANQALFSLMGTIYGGDGRANFALPDMRGRSSLHAGAGPGLSIRRLGEKSGKERVSVISNKMPSHSHNARADQKAASDVSPNNRVWAGRRRGALYTSGPADVKLGASVIAATGGGQAHNNMSPYAGLSCIIALAGVFP